MYSWLLVLVVLMAGGSQGGKRRRSAKQTADQPAEDAGSEYNPTDESSDDSPVVSPAGLSTRKGKEHAVEKEGRSKKVADKPAAKKTTKKSKKSAIWKGKEKATEVGQGSVRRRPRAGGVEIREPGSTSPPHTPDAPIDPRRRSMFSLKHCIGERMVGVVNLFNQVPGFQPLFENGNLHTISDFRKQTGYGLELIREFYMRAGHVDESKGGPYIFTTSVRGIALSITPATIASVLDMAAKTDGVDYLNAGFDAVRDWRCVMTAICVPGTVSNGVLILSKDLKLEYRFLNFVVCYNIMPLANTKVIRWDRVLYMYVLGHPEICQAKDINLNVPFFIWKRMVKEIKTSSQKDRLPFPMLIMQIL